MTALLVCVHWIEFRQNRLGAYRVDCSKWLSGLQPQCTYGSAWYGMLLTPLVGPWLTLSFTARDRGDDWATQVFSYKSLHVHWTGS